MEQAEEWAKNEWKGFRKQGESYFEASVAWYCRPENTLSCCIIANIGFTA